MRKLTLSVIAVAAGATVLVASGCQAGSSDPLVGTWTADLNTGGTSGSAEATYGADGTFHALLKTKAPVGAGEFQLVQDGKWAYDKDKKLKITISTLDMKLIGATPEMEKMLAANNTPEAKKKMIDQANASPATAITWKGNDEFTTAMSNEELTFKRKK